MTTDTPPIPAAGLSEPAGPPANGAEIDTLVGALERNRRTFAWKCGGLGAAETAPHPRPRLA